MRNNFVWFWLSVPLLVGAALFFCWKCDERNFAIERDLIKAEQERDIGKNSHRKSVQEKCGISDFDLMSVAWKKIDSCIDKGGQDYD